MPDLHPTGGMSPQNEPSQHFRSFNLIYNTFTLADENILNMEFYAASRNYVLQ